MITNQNLQIIHKKLRERHPHITLKKIIKSQEKKPGQEERNRELARNSQKTVNKTAISTCLSTMTLDVNKYSNQKTEWLNGLKDKTHIYAYKRLISDRRTHRLNAKEWRRYSTR